MMTMSKENIMRRAEEALTYWDQGSMWSRLIERDIDENDLESLQYHVDEADAQMNMQESFNEEFMRRLVREDSLIDPNGWPALKMPVGVEGIENDAI
jgi:hypothetical protein